LKWYEAMGKIWKPFDFLFVDTFRCARVTAMKNFSPSAQVVLLHDLEPPSPEYYQYHLMGDCMKDFHKYLFAPKGTFGGHHNIPWTALYSREFLDLEKFRPVTNSESQRLWGMDAELELADD